MRVKATLRYDGSLFHGYQIQTETPHTVAGHLKHALQALNISSDIVAAGRTDRGVHATGQVIHFDLPDFWRDLKKLKQHLNHKLEGITLQHIVPVEQSFHARFSAIKRSYYYLFKTVPPHIFEKNYLSFYPPFETQKLHHALTLFEGKHNFIYFHKQGSTPHTTLRTLYKASYKQFKTYHIIHFQGNAFLRSQVRMMVEAAMLHTQGLLSLEALKEQLEGKEQYTTRLAPPQGLYLSKIYY
jgi:tRNA pseudouridine38-40 synthase